MSDTWLTTKQVAELLQMHPDVVTRRLRAGEIRGRKFNRVWRVRPEDLADAGEDYVPVTPAPRRVAPTPAPKLRRSGQRKTKIPPVSSYYPE